MVFEISGLMISNADVWLGILGSVFIAAAWSYEMWESIERHKSLIDLRFAGIYFIGNLFLLAYSLALQNMVFIAINAALSILVLFEISYTIGWKFGNASKSRNRSKRKR